MRGLLLMRDCFREPLLQANARHGNAAVGNAVRTIFSNLDMVIDVSRRINDALQAKQQQGSLIDGCAQCFLPCVVLLSVDTLCRVAFCQCFMSCCFLSILRVVLLSVDALCRAAFCHTSSPLIVLPLHQATTTKNCLRDHLRGLCDVSAAMVAMGLWEISLARRHTLSLPSPDEYAPVTNVKRTTARSTHRVGDVFVGFVGSEAYATFCAQQTPALEAIKHNRLLYGFVDEVIGEGERNPSCMRLSLPDFICSVFQRVTRYPLLLSTLLKVGWSIAAVYCPPNK